MKEMSCDGATNALRYNVSEGVYALVSGADALKLRSYAVLKSRKSKFVVPPFSDGRALRKEMPYDAVTNALKYNVSGDV
jgi:hypothetical protein